jgi:ATP-dependent Clp protease protease subunit
MSGLGGQASDIDIHAKEILRQREMLNEIMAHHTGQTASKIQDDTDRDNIMRPTQAKDYGIIDDVLTRRA